MGYVWRAIEKELLKYLDFLKEIEDGLYDSEYNLREGLLRERVKSNPRWKFISGERTVEPFVFTSSDRQIHEKGALTPRLGQHDLSC